jgi:hypothetical protein
VVTGRVIFWSQSSESKY